MCSLVTQLEMPTLWSEGEGRCQRDQITETFRWISRGSRDGMYRKKDNAVRETRSSGGAEPPTDTYKASAERVVGCYGSRRGS